ncbi:MAG: hypothetical protein ACM3PW_04170 [Chlamydiota bacterium]
MKTKPRAIWAALILVLAMSLGCREAKFAEGGPAGRKYTIHIRTINGQCVIDIPKLNVELTDQPTIEWKSDDSPKKSYTANFDVSTNHPPGSPFGDSANPKKKVTTDEGAQSPQRTGDYLYSVRVGNSTTDCIPPTDPGVYVK